MPYISECATGLVLRRAQRRPRCDPEVVSVERDQSQRWRDSNIARGPCEDAAEILPGDPDGDQHTKRREQRQSLAGHLRSTREEQLDECKQRGRRRGVGTRDLGESMTPSVAIHEQPHRRCLSREEVEPDWSSFSCHSDGIEVSRGSEVTRRADCSSRVVGHLRRAV